MRRPGLGRRIHCSRRMAQILIRYLLCSSRGTLRRAGAHMSTSTFFTLCQRNKETR
jgi:hypothetical protein